MFNAKYFKSVTILLRRELDLRSCTNMVPRHFSAQSLDAKYSNVEKEKIINTVNSSDEESLLRYGVTKARIKKFVKWKNDNGVVKEIGDLETEAGFTNKSAMKLCDSILNGIVENGVTDVSSKIKGQFLHPALTEEARLACKSVLAVYVTVNSVSWTLIERSYYEVREWRYQALDDLLVMPKDGKKLLLTDIYEMAWRVTEQLPTADMYVMKAEPTTLRAAGSDPNNPKVIAVNLQKSQMIAMMVALINVRSRLERRVPDEQSKSSDDVVMQNVYFLRPTLPYRLYGTLIGNENIATDQTVENLLQNITSKSETQDHVYVSDDLKGMFRAQKDLEKDMLGHCLLLGLTFMDLCIYKNQNRIKKLLKRAA